MAEEMTLREKGDLYWKKQKYYLASCAVREGYKDNYVNQDMAAEVLSRYEALKEKGEMPLLTGKEFREKPPTPVGKQAFADSVAAVMYARDRIEDIIAGRSEASAALASFTEGMSEYLDEMKQAVADYLAASGVDEKGELHNDLKLRASARDSWVNSCIRYEAEAERINRSLGEGIMKDLKEKAGIEERMEAGDIGESPELAEFLAGFGEIDTEKQKIIKSIYTVSMRSRKEMAERSKSLEMLRELVINEYFDPATDPVRKYLMSLAFSEYSSRVARNVSDLLYVEEACLACAKWVLAGEKTDGILAEKMWPEWGVTPDTLDEGMTFSEIPGFVHLQDENEEEEEERSLTTVEEFRSAGEELRAFLYTKPWLFDAQTLKGIATGTEGLMKTLALAKKLRYAIDRAFAEGRMEGLGVEEQEGLFRIFVMADAMCRVGYRVAEFSADHERATVGDTLNDLREELEFMHYSDVEKDSREAIKAAMAERRA
ncbi:MAG: hypothetical protein IKI75_11960 [Lachnospiraceae bacterium]|nr:hypothetical protein [Lachnospiraceae bacterium]